MKPLISMFVLLAVAATSGCALNTAATQANQSNQQSMQGMMPVEKKGICANTKILPLNQCAETVSAVFDNKGVLWIAWPHNDHIFVQLSLDKGLSFSDPLLVNAVPEPVIAHAENRPKIKLDPEGNIYLTWTTKLKKRFSGNIRFSRSTDGGRHFSEPVTINDNLEIISHRFDSLAIGKNGEIFIAWLDGRDAEAAKKAGQAFEGSSLYYAWSDDGGRHFNPNKRIAAHTCQCCRLDTAINQGNKPVIIWRHLFDGGIRDHAINRFSDWHTPGDIMRLSRENWKIDACPHHGPALSIADNAIYHAVWFSNAETRQGLFYAYSNDSGQHFSAPVNFGNAGASHPHVLALGNRVGIVWQEFDGRHNVIKMLKSADGGQSWTQPELIARSTETTDDPFLVSDGKAMYLSWKIQQRAYHLQAIE